MAESGTPLFPSFFGGGFECSTHQRAHDRRRLDLVAASGHDAHAGADYRTLARHGLRWARDGLRWHLVETRAGRYTWGSFLPQLRAARAAGVTAVWDLCHYGWPDGLDVWRPAFVERLAAFARAAARLVQSETDEVPFWCPINEISFMAWAGGDAAYLPPFARGRGFELKVQLARAAIAAIEAVRGVDARARIVQAEPLIHIAASAARPHERAQARGHRQAQFQAWDLVRGTLWPQLGGQRQHLDILGVNYYSTNQWVHGGGVLQPGQRGYRPLARLLAEVHRRYRRPLVIAETGHEGAARAPWLAAVCDAAQQARTRGVPVEGVCLYPVCNHPGWDDERHCPNGLLGYPDAWGRRPVYQPLARELEKQRARMGVA